MTAPTFQLINVGRTFGARVALRQVSIEIPAGQIVALVGPSGAGKSTFIRLLAGVLKPTTGQLSVDGKETAAWSWRELQKHRGCCRIIEQSHLLVTQLSVHQNTISGHLALWPWYKVLAAALWPIEKERVVIERTGGNTTAVTPGSDAFQSGEVARMEVYEETPDIHKEAFVREEVSIRKEVDRETVQAEEQLRREELDVDKEGRTMMEQEPKLPSEQRSK